MAKPLHVAVSRQMNWHLTEDDANRLLRLQNRLGLNKSDVLRSALKRLELYEASKKKPTGAS